MKNDMPIEQAFQVIEEKLKAMEKEDITLEESFATYKEGMELVALCAQNIDNIEKKVKVINEDMKLNEF